MAFNRARAPASAPESDALTSAMVGIGMVSRPPINHEPVNRVTDAVVRLGELGN
jgi:hypothetical protein